MRPPMLNIAYKQVQTRNEYGDYTSTSEVALPCHFRFITEQVSADTNEQIQSDAMAWFEPDSGIERKDILKIEGEFFRVERVIKARRLRETAVQFIKVELLKYGVIS